MKSVLALGLDFGTESVRALVVDTETGEDLGQGISKYAHGVMDQEFFGKSLPKDFALQDAQDYLDSMTAATRLALDEMRRTHPEYSANQITGIGVDFTASSPMPVAQGEPLSLRAKQDPHAYVKLWKHHAAQPFADFINAHAPKELLRRYGGMVSSEWSLPKLLELEANAPGTFEKTEQWIESGDWIVSVLAGRTQKPARSTCQAGYKGLWDKQYGYPSPEFLKSCSPRVAARFEQLFAGEILPLGSEAGKLTSTWAERLGLREGTSVAVAAIDAHAGVPGSGVFEAGNVLCVLGTSTCHMALGHELTFVPGIAGAVRDGIIPGLVGFEAGQPAVGDLFAWFLKMQGKAPSPSEFAALEEQAAHVPPGSNGVTALDWWNGNRSVLMDSRMQGTLVGLRLTTTSADIYRSLIEATAFSTRLIIERMSEGGIPINHVTLTGGIASKSPLLCQIYADVLGKPVDVVHARQPIALGAAIYGAAAAHPQEAFGAVAAKMTARIPRTRVECLNNSAYERPYQRFLALHDVMHRYYIDCSID